MKILRAADYKTMPWKNGMGSTTEIAIFPANATLDDFDWRVSMAQVTSDGTFSSFAGIDRTLLVLEGNGIDLDVMGYPPARIDRAAIHRFPGDRPTSATLVDGPILDLNVMTRRNAIVHDVQRINISRRQDFIVSAQMLLLVEHGRLEIVEPAPMTQLRARDAVMLDPTTPMLRVSASTPTQIIAVYFRQSSMPMASI